MEKGVGPGGLSRNPQICCATGKMRWAGFEIVHGREDVDSYRRDQSDGRQESGDCRGAFGASRSRGASVMSCSRAAARASSRDTRKKTSGASAGARDRRCETVNLGQG
jgi:hypothetical protein